MLAIDAGNTGVPYTKYGENRRRMHFASRNPYVKACRAAVLVGVPTREAPIIDWKDAMDLSLDLDAVEGREEPGVVIGAVRTTFLRMVARCIAVATSRAPHVARLEMELAVRARAVSGRDVARHLVSGKLVAATL